MDIPRAVSRIFADPRWIEKIGIGSLIMLVPILNFAAFGYQVRMVRQIRSGSEPEMWDWDDLVNLWREGVWIVLALMVYSLPLLAILAAAAVAGIPFLVLLDRQPETGWIPLLLLCGASAVFMMFYGIVVGLLRPAIIGSYAGKATFAACFDFSEIFRLIGSSLSAYLTLWLILLAMGILYAGLSVVLLLPLALIPFLGQALAPLLQSAGLFLMMVIEASLIAQWLQVAVKVEAASTPADAPR